MLASLKARIVDVYVGIVHTSHNCHIVYHLRPIRQIDRMYPRQHRNWAVR